MDSDRCSEVTSWAVAASTPEMTPEHASELEEKDTTNWVPAGYPQAITWEGGRRAGHDRDEHTWHIETLSEQPLTIQISNLAGFWETLLIVKLLDHRLEIAECITVPSSIFRWRFIAKIKQKTGLYRVYNIVPRFFARVSTLAGARKHLMRSLRPIYSTRPHLGFPERLRVRAGGWVSGEG